MTTPSASANSPSFDDSGPIRDFSRALERRANERFTGRFLIESLGVQGEFRLADGRLVHTQMGPQSDAGALVRALLADDGTFVVEDRSYPNRDSAPAALEALSEAWTETEVLRESAEQVGGLSRAWTLRFRALDQALKEIPREISPLLRLLDGTRSVRDLFVVSPLPPRVTIRVLSRLLGMGILVLPDAALDGERDSIAREVPSADDVAAKAPENDVAKKTDDAAAKGPADDVAKKSDGAAKKAADAAKKADTVAAKKANAVAKKAEDTAKKAPEVAKKADDASKKADTVAAKKAKPAAAKAPEVAKKADAVAKKADDAARKAPEVAKKANAVAKKAEDTAKKAPEVAKKADDAAKKSDDVAKKAEDAARKSDDAAKKSPEVATKAPDAAKKADDAAKKSPEVATKAPTDDTATNKADDVEKKANDVAKKGAAKKGGDKKADDAAPNAPAEDAPRPRPLPAPENAPTASDEEDIEVNRWSSPKEAALPPALPSEEEFLAAAQSLPSKSDVDAIDAWLGSEKDFFKTSTREIQRKEAAEIKTEPEPEIFWKLVAGIAVGVAVLAVLLAVFGDWDDAQGIPSRDRPEASTTK